MIETHRLPNRCMEVRERAGFDGVHAKEKTPVPAFMQKRREAPSGIPVGGGLKYDADLQMRLATCAQQKSTSRQWAPSAAYPSQMRPAEPNREVIPKNLKDFSITGRNIGVHGAYDAVGGYAMRDKAGEDVTEKFTQRTFDDFKNYFLPRPVDKSVRGNNGVYSEFYQHRIEARELTYKNTPGRYAGAFKHDLRLVGSAQDHLTQKGQFVTEAYGEDRNPQVLKETMKRDDGMVFRQREDEAPDRTGLRMNYADVYNSGWEKLETHRRKQADIERSIDHSMLRAYHTNPYTQPLGIVPPLGHNNTGLNGGC